MSDNGFALDWLRLRAPFDAAAADTPEAAALAKAFGAHMRNRRTRGALRLLDLGGGSGANICRLAPRIPGSQDWRLVDSDAALLAAVGDTIAAWARRIGVRCERGGDGSVRLTTPQRIITVAMCRHDLRNGLDALNLADTDGVTGSALLDLVSAEWLDAAVAMLAGHGLPMLFTFNADGRFVWTPGAEADGPVVEAFRSDLATDKGFGAALGAGAPVYAEQAMAAAGYGIETVSADWHVGTSAPQMHRAMLSFFEPVARKRVPPGWDATGWHDIVTEWEEAKSAQISDGTLVMTVGHTDLLAVL